jgi:hypothetical protein
MVDRALRRRNPDRAVALFGDMERAGDLSPVDEAQFATALLGAGDYRDAQRRFVALQKEIKDEPDLRYVEKYCRYYLALMRNERSQADYEWKLAQAAPKSRRTRKRLPMAKIKEKPSLEVVATFSLR